MKLTKILEHTLYNLAENSVKAKTHRGRKKTDRTAYGFIQEICDGKREIEYWNQYYIGAKMCVHGRN